MGRIVVDGNLFVRLFRPTEDDPFTTPDGLEPRSPGFFTVSDEVVSVPPGGTYDLPLDRWPYLSWNWYFNRPHADDAGTWCLQARFDASDGQDWSAPADGPPPWQTTCLSAPISITFAHTTPASQP